MYATGICDPLAPSFHVSASSPCKLFANNSINGVYDLKSAQHNKQTSSHLVSNNHPSEATQNMPYHQQHRKSQSIASNMFSNLLNDTKEALNELKLKQHPLDESFELCVPSDPHLTSSSIQRGVDQTALPQIIVKSPMVTASSSSASSCNNANDLLINELPTLLQQKQLLQSVKINDPSSLLKELLKHRHNSATLSTSVSNSTNQHSKSHHHHHHHHNHHSSLKKHLSCYYGAELDDDSDENENNYDLDENCKL
jgi:hypothetical protein